MSIGSFAAAFSGFILQSLDPLAYRGINVAVLAIVSRRRFSNRGYDQKRRGHEEERFCSVDIHRMIRLS